MSTHSNSSPSHHPIRITAKCPIRTTLELIGGKWKLLIIHQLQNGPHRFSELKRLIPDISDKMLTHELSILTESGLVVRKKHTSTATYVEYILDKRGERVKPVIDAMINFAQQYVKGG
jgi:DNA-binding HxlR family transcriptional regulator